MTMDAITHTSSKEQCDMSSLNLQDLLEAGAHFGHQTKRWNPKMKRYILCSRNGVYIVDLEKTVQGIADLIARVKTEVAAGGKVLFVGTKKQIKDCMREEATRCNMPYVTERWLGGMLTNFQTIKLSIRRLEKIEAMEADGTIEAFTKKEIQTLAKKKEKLLTVLGGIRNLRRLPAIVFVVDTIKEHIAVSEARRLRIPIGAIVDTNCDPEEIDYVIPGNDDALKSVQLIVTALADAIIEASGASKAEEALKAAKPDEASDAGADLPDDGLEPEEIVEGEEGVVGDAGKPRRRRVVRRKLGETLKPADEV